MLKFFGGGEDGAVARVATSALRPWPRTLAAPMVHEEGDAGHGRSQAMLDALCWALRNPKHALPTAPPLAQPPAEAMGLLVGRAVEVFWPVERAWYSGLANPLP